MGTMIFDQYTYLHFASGIVSYFWGISLLKWLFIHTIFEFVENTKLGIKIINNYFTLWPGGKPKADSVINSYGDTLGAIIGWISAFYIDKYGIKHKLYT